MTKEKLYEMLEIDGPQDLEYFEQFADLIECPEDIPYEFFAAALSAIRSEDAGEITENYIEEISKALPDSADDLTGLLDTIKSRLLMLAENLESKETRRAFIEELFKFREWYTEPFGVSIDGNPASLLEAVTSCRMERLGEGSHKYDLSPRLDYRLDELSMDLGAFSTIDILDESEKPLA